MNSKSALLLSACCFFCLHIQAQNYHDILITEMMTDPSPSVGLPEVEYLELYNRSGKSVSLKEWKLVVGTRSVILPDSSFGPNSFLIICNKNNVAALAGFGAVVGLPGFALANDEATVSLYKMSGQLMHSVPYKLSWWSLGKRDGGYAIEMIDTDSPCADGSNWAAAANARGGTPGTTNSTQKVNPDSNVPVLERVVVASPVELTLVFSKRIDSLNAVKGASIAVSGRSILSKKLDTPAFRNLKITLGAALIAGQSYGLTLGNLADCAGNILRQESVLVGLPAKADSGDIILNEILFNPREDGVDYIELYNRSGSYLSLKNWTIANMKNGQSDVTRPITNEDVVLGPHQFLVLTTEPDVVRKQYPADVSRRFLAVASLPAFSNAAGGVVLKNEAGKIWDQFVYTEAMQYELIKNPKGVALEKIDPYKPAGDPENWHSAASTSGYGTPGYANSQRFVPETADTFIVEPEAFSPDQDGVDDVANIRYLRQVGGQMATIRVFDVNGNLVKNILQNKLIGTSANLVWDGTDEKGNLISTGYYLVLIDTFDLNGNKKQYRKRIVAAVK